MSDPVPVVFTFDKRVVWPSAVAVQSLMDAAHPATRYEIHLLHPGFPPRMVRGFEAMVEGTRHRIFLHAVDLQRFAGLPMSRGSWTEIVYCRFLIPEVLAGHRRAIYSDTDVFFTGDLSDLIAVDMEECPVGAVAAEVNGPDMECHTYFPENPNPQVFMSGFLLMDLQRMRQEQLTEKLLATARRYSGRLRMFDLEALNLTCRRILPLSIRYSLLETLHVASDVADAAEFPWLSRVHPRAELEAAKASPVVIHYAGPLGKPWRRPDPPSYYRSYLDRVPVELRVRSMRDIRKYWVHQILDWFRGGEQ